jgi:hypothetical protein
LPEPPLGDVASSLAILPGGAMMWIEVSTAHLIFFSASLNFKVGFER